jgi:hypothetical protein
MQYGDADGVERIKSIGQVSSFGNGNSILVHFPKFKKFRCLVLSSLSSWTVRLPIKASTSFDFPGDFKKSVC